MYIDGCLPKQILHVVKICHSDSYCQKNLKEKKNLHVDFFLRGVHALDNLDKFFGLQRLENFVQLNLHQVRIDTYVPDPSTLVAGTLDDLVHDFLFLKDGKVKKRETNTALL